jgi:energy-coupling factor transporter ATP-binding protein EcfA2
MADAFSIGVASYEAIRIAKREKLLDRAIDLFRQKNRVMLLGSTGAGKSQFLDSVADVLPPPRPASARTEFVNIRRFDLNGVLIDFIDTPGQLEHRPRRDEALKQALKLDLKGVINFVSYGYHEYGVPANEVIYNGRVRSSYLQEHRQREIDLLTEWAPLMGAEWILTVVTKADIWYDDQQEALAHYAQGEYFKQLRNAYPTAHHVVRGYSSISARFYDSIPGAESFDDRIRTSLRAEIFRALGEAITRFVRHS